jgi:ABC-2 type transport system ATP-binding protein
VTAIRASGLEKAYGDVRALDGMSLTVEAGDLLGFLGANGAGKTTTIRVLTGQVVPDGGTAAVDGVDPVADPVAARARIGILPEQASPPTYLTPREYFSLVGAVRQIPDDRRRSRVDEWTDRLGFEPRLDTLCGDLSRGQQQKVMMTAAFLHDPDVVLVDEPLANLDPIVQERVKTFLADYCRAGNAVLLSTHHVEVAADLCTRVAIVRAGCVHEEYGRVDAATLRSAFLGDE